MNRFKLVKDYFFKSIDEKVFTSASVLASCNGDVVFQKNFGQTSGAAGNNCESRLFDLASLTKPLATALFFQILWQKNLISPDDCVSDYIKEFQTKDKKNIKLENLLLHNSGLPAHRNYYRILSGIPFNERESARLLLIAGEPLVYRPGKSTLYSDLGFMVLKYICEKVSKDKIGSFMNKELYEKINSGLFFASGVKVPVDLFVPSSFSFFRNKFLQGEVNDENASVIGGEDGHAGLFGNCTDIHLVLREIFNSFTGKKHAVLNTDYTKEILKIRNNKRSYGFDTPSEKNSSSGDFFSLNSFGHLGFTGTSFWMDTDKKIWIILLTNRVYYGSKNLKIKYFRSELHNKIIKAI
ncbi:MAG: serine hydrolase domain-containing protein [Thermodesulfobacteriota bacterium]